MFYITCKFRCVFNSFSFDYVRLFAIIVTLMVSVFIVQKGVNAQTIVDDQPVYDLSTEKAIFLWKDTNDVWHLRATAGAVFANYIGSVVSNQPFTLVSPISVEMHDVFETSNPLRIDFDFRMWSGSEDGFDFTFPLGAEVCLNVFVPSDQSLLVGVNKVPVQTPFNLVTLASCVGIDPNGKPVYNLSTDQGVFMWKDTDGIWHLRTTGGGDYSNYVGSLVSDLPFTSISPVSNENSDVLDTSDPLRIDFDFQIWGPSEDGIDFTFPAEADVCLEIGAPFDPLLILGQNNLSVPTPFNLSTLAACGDPNPNGKPDYDLSTDQGIFMWKDLAGGWHLRTSSGGSYSNYIGSIASDLPFTSVTPILTETHDILDTTNPLQIDFDFQMWGNSEDGISFEFPIDANVCVDIETPIDQQLSIGVDKTLKETPFDITTLSSCKPKTDGLYNFVVILTDDQRWDTIWAMPVLQEKLMSRGVTFTNAFVTTPLCCPSRASILSGGYYPFNTGVYDAIVGSDNGSFSNFSDTDTLATALQQTGYKTMCAGGKYMNGYTPQYVPPGWSKFVINNQGPFSANWFDYKVTIGSGGRKAARGNVVSSQRYVTNFHRDKVLEFIDEVNGSPFFIYFSVFAPHYPATPDIGDETLFSDYIYRGRSYNEADLSDKPDWVSNPARYLSVKEGGGGGDDEFRRNQLRSLQAVDRAIGDIFDKVESSGLLDKTVFIFTSDNGFLWGEHGLYRKGQAYEESIRVPFVVLMPGVAPRTDDNLISINLDIGATLLDLAGVPKDTDGLSLVPLLESPSTPWRTEVLCQHWGSHEGAFGTWSSIRTAKWKYIVNAYAEEELYDLELDPFEEESLHNNPDFNGILSSLSDKLGSQRGLAPLIFTGTKGFVGQNYNMQIPAWGNPINWNLEFGNLPDGLNLDTSTGLISGIPTKVEQQQVKIRIEDSSIAEQIGVPRSYIAPGSPNQIYNIIIEP